MAKIAVIDDNEELRKSICALLHKEGYAVVDHPGKEGVGRFVAHERPDVVVLDYLLGGRTGADVVREFGDHPTTAHIPIIALSAHPSAQLLMADKGVYAFLGKPCSADALCTKIHLALQGGYVPSRASGERGSFT